MRRFDTIEISRMLERTLRTIPHFEKYELDKFDVNEISSPTKFTNYDFTFISNEYDRWVFIRLQDYQSHLNLNIWVNKLLKKEKTNFDIRYYFISELDIKSIKQKLIFKANNLKELENSITKIFDYIIKNSDEQLNNILAGKLWIDMPFDWGEYK